MVKSVSAASSSGTSSPAIAPKPRSRPASAYATAKTTAASRPTAVSGSGTRESSTWDAVDRVTTSAVKIAARATLSCVPEMSIAGKCVMRRGKRTLKEAESPARDRARASGGAGARRPGPPRAQAGPRSPGIFPLRNRSTKIWWSARARAP